MLQMLQGRLTTSSCRPSYFSQARIHQKGQTLVEALLAIVLIGITVLGISQLISLFAERNTSVAWASCREIAMSTLSRVEALGDRAYIQRFDIKNGSLIATTGTSGIYTPPTVPPALRWPNEEAYRLFEQTPSGPQIVRNFHLINGTMAALQALYNSDPAYCTQANGMTLPIVNGETMALEGNKVGIWNAQVRLRIQPYNLETLEADDPCPNRPFFIRPLAGSASPPGFGSGEGDLQFPANSSSNRGFLATVFVTYTDSANREQSCSSSQRYNYPADNRDPQQPELTITDKNTPLPVCSNFSARATATVQFSSPIEAGSIVVCKDASKRDGLKDSGRLGQAGSACTLGGGVYIEASAEADPNKKWVPCDLVTACGQSPTTTSVNSNDNGPVYRMEYNNLWWNCELRILAKAIDTAGNSSASQVSVAEYIAAPECETCTSPVGTQCPTCSGGGGGPPPASTSPAPAPAPAPAPSPPIDTGMGPPPPPPAPPPSSSGTTK